MMLQILEIRITTWLQTPGLVSHTKRRSGSVIWIAWAYEKADAELSGLAYLGADAHRKLPLVAVLTGGAFVLKIAVLAVSNRRFNRAVIPAKKIII